MLFRSGSCKAKTIPCSPAMLSCMMLSMSLPRLSTTLTLFKLSISLLSGMQLMSNSKNSDDKCFSCDAGASWPDGEKLLNYLKEVDHVGLTGEIRFDSEGFRTDIQLDLIEKMRGRFKKTATWTPENGVNYTMTTEEIGTNLIQKLANRTLRVTTTTVGRYLSIEWDTHY